MTKKELKRELKSTDDAASYCCEAAGTVDAERIQDKDAYP